MQRPRNDRRPEGQAAAVEMLGDEPGTSLVAVTFALVNDEDLRGFTAALAALALSSLVEYRSGPA